MALSHESANPVTPALAPGSASSTIIPLPPVSPGPQETPFFSTPNAHSAGPSRPRSPAAETEQDRQARHLADHKQAKRPFPPHMHVPGSSSSASGNGHSGAGGPAHRAGQADEEHIAEGTRTPRPKMLTPSPPGSRRNSGEVTRNRGSGSGGVAAVMQGRKEGEGDMAVLMRTIAFAAEKHSCQRRKDVDQTPYINHPIAVSNFLSATGITDVRVLQAAVLHDTVEDTHTTLREIAQNFGQDVARIVDECTDNPNLSSQSRKAEQIRTAPYKSKEAQQVKLADKLHNLESIRRCPPVGWTKRRIQAYFIWAKQVTDICSASHPALGDLLTDLYKTAYTRVDGEYFPCHPDECGPFSDAEKARIDKRLNGLKRGEKVCPNPIFF